jgi:hypothetical protein
MKYNKQVPPLSFQNYWFGISSCRPSEEYNSARHSFRKRGRVHTVGMK